MYRTWPNLPSASKPNDELYLSDAGGETNVGFIATDEQEVDRSESDADSDSYDDSDDEEFPDRGKAVWHGSHEGVIRRSPTASQRGSVEPSSPTSERFRVRTSLSSPPPDRDLRMSRDKRSQPFISNSPSQNVRFEGAEEQEIVDLPSANPLAEPPVTSTSTGSRAARSVRERKKLEHFNADQVTCMVDLLVSLVLRPV